MMIIAHDKDYAMPGEKAYKSAKEVKADYPSAVKVVKVCGGWAVFEYWADYETWKNQK